MWRNETSPEVLRGFIPIGTLAGISNRELIFRGTLFSSRLKSRCVKKRFFKKKDANKIAVYIRENLSVVIFSIELVKNI